MLYDINTGEWDTELLKLFTVPPAILPDGVLSSHVVAPVAVKSIIGGIPIGGSHW